jgi:glycosyltransferase involved in cell wall biosynthesis
VNTAPRDASSEGLASGLADTPCELTIVLPCLDEAETLAVCVRKAHTSIMALGINGEVVVADNGSSDGSQKIARAEGARVVDVHRRGYGAALRGGIEGARGQYVLMADADDSYALDDIGGFLEGLRGGADLVMGNRFKGGIRRGAMPLLHRRLGNPALSWLGRLFFQIPVGDFHCGMRAFRRERVLELGMQANGMEFASEMLVRGSLAKLSIVEVPTVLSPDGRSRRPHLRTWRDGWRHLRFLLAFSPRWLLLYPAMTLVILGLAGLVTLGFGTRELLGVSFSVQSMLVCATAVVVGIQAAGLALVSHGYVADLNIVPPSPSIERLLHRLTLERGLAIGVVLVLAGVGAFVTALALWGSKGFGQLDVISTIRVPIIGMVLVVGGLQVMMVSLTMSLVQTQQFE